MNKKPIPLVLLHGFASNQSVWEACATQLASSYSVTTLDLPGYGENSAVNCANLADIAQFLLTQITAPVVWVGWSLGGLIARYLAHYAPSHTLGLMTIASNPKFIAGPNWPCGVLNEDFSALRSLFELTPDKGLSRFFSLQNQGLSKETARQLLAFKKSAALIAKDTLLRDLDILKNTDLRYAQANTPELNIFGSHDPLVPIQITTALKDLYPQAQNATISQAGHVPHLSHAPECLTHIHKFIHESIALY